MTNAIVRSKLHEILLNEIPPHVLSSEWEEIIIKMLREPVDKKYNTLIHQTLEEVKKMYFEEMKNFGLQTILSSKEKVKTDFMNTMDFEIKRPEFENSEFLKNKESFIKKYFLSHVLVRNIIRISSTNLPNVFFDIKCCNSSNVRTIHDIFDNVKQCIRRMGLEIIKNVYSKIVKSMLRMPELKKMNKEQLTSLLRCATAVLSQTVVNSMMYTINYLINTLTDARNYPRMKLDLIYEQSIISLNPTLTDIFSAFHSIVDDVTGIAQDLIPLEYWMNIDTDGYIKIKLPDWFLQESHTKLQFMLEEAFQQLKLHCEIVNAEFSNIDTVTVPEDFTREISQEEFHEFCKQVEVLNEFLCRAKVLVSEVYFQVSTLEQTQASKHLQDYITTKIDVILTKLVSHHQNFVMYIYSEFEKLESRALDIPEDTKLLFELCDYLSYASKTIVKELEIKIQSSIKMLNSLLQVTSLSEQHMELNGKVINKLWNIEQTFFRSNNSCEAMKSILEDELQKKVNVLNVKVDEIIPELIILNDMDDIVRVKEYSEFLLILVGKIFQIEEEITSINMEEKLFKFPETTFPKIIEIKEVLLPFDSLIHLVCEWRKDHDIWMNGLFDNLNPNEIEKKTSRYHQELTTINATFKLKIKTEMVLTKAFKFSGIVDDPDPMQHPAPLKLCWQALRDINVFQRYVPLAMCMCNKSLAIRHWNEMSTIAGLDITPNARTTLKTMVDLNLFDNLHKYQVISISANKELALKNQLIDMTNKWDNISFTIHHKEDKKLFCFQNEDRIDALLQDHIIKVQQMKYSNFVKPIENEVNTFSMSLNRLQYCMEQLLVLQTEINEIESLFSNELIASEMTEGNKLYKRVNEVLNNIRDMIMLKLKFQKLFATSELFDNIKKATLQFGDIIAIINDFLQGLKYEFPRLFFLMEKDIIKLLDWKNNVVFQKYFSKCFSGLRIRINNKFHICTAIGVLGERMELNSTVPINLSSVTKISCVHWLNSFEKEISLWMKNAITESSYLFNELYSSQLDQFHWEEKFPGIIIICRWYINWTFEIDSCISQSKFEIDKLKICFKKYQGYKNVLIQQLKHNLGHRCRNIIITLITIQIYEDNFLKRLIYDGIEKERDFFWQTQMKYYVNNSKVQISVMNNVIEYGYEYYGFQEPGIIITPLTERCYHSMIMAYKYNASAAIVGPVGTGKSYTFKSLAIACAKLFYLFDCNINFQYNYMTSIFTGFVLAGPWICFKNFCCLKPEYYSIIGHYISNINKTKTMKSKIIDINGRTMQFNHQGFICATMNSYKIDKIYILDEAKYNFQTFSIMKPDIKEIIEICLTAAGFVNAKDLTVILTTILSFLNNQKFDNQTIYCSLYQIKEIIKIISYKKILHPDKCEKVLLFRTLVDIFIPKLNKNETMLFENLIHDTFPNVIFPSSDYMHLLRIIEELSMTKNYHLHDTFKLKIIQLFEMVHLQRFLIISGQPLVGKTSILKILAEAISLSFTLKSEFKSKYQINMSTINQNATSLATLYNLMNDPKWMVQKAETLWNWLIFDGNTSGASMEIMQILITNDKSNIRPFSEQLSTFKRTSIIFETNDLQHASPTVISQYNILHIETFDYMINIKHNIIQLYPKYKDIIVPLIDWSVTASLQFIKKNCLTILNVQNNHLILSTWKLFKIFLEHAFEMNKNEKEIKRDHAVAWFQGALVMATMWGLGGSLEEYSQKIFDSFCVSLWTDKDENFPRPKQVKSFENLILNEESLREHFYVFKGVGSWKHCGDVLKTENILENSLGFRELFVPTLDTIKYSTVLRYNLQHRQPFILCSNATSGKSAFLKYFFEEKIDDLNFSTNYYHMMSSMDVKNTQKYMLSKMFKLKYNSYKGNNKRCINFIDDMNLAIETNKATPILELIRQHMDHHYWIDVEKLEKIYLNETMFCFAFKKSSATICPRFLRHFMIYSFHPPSKDNMSRIFTNVLFSNLKKNSFTSDVLSNVNNIVNATIAIYLSVKQHLVPIPLKFQYLFDMRDICKIISSCSLIQRDSVETKIIFLRLWVHETFHVFGDKIIVVEDKKWLFSQIKETVKTNFKDSFETAFDHLPKGSNNYLNEDSLKQLFFGNFIENDKELNDIRRYEEINSLSVLKNKLLQYINELNDNFKEKVNIVLTNYFVENLVKMCRILTIPGGNLLMICGHGSGRRTITRLAAYIQKQKFIELTLTSIYDDEHWEKHLKETLNECGIAGTDVTFLCKDRQMSEQYLQYISSLIKFGEIPQLFSNDDWQEIIRNIRLFAQTGDRNMELPIDNIKEYFIRQCKQKLHFVICTNPLESKKLTTFIQNYSNLTSCCHMDWWDNWPQNALQQTALSYMINTKMSENTKIIVLETGNDFYTYMQDYFQSENNRIPVPTTYIRMVELYVNLIFKVEENLTNTRKEYLQGLEKLESASLHVQEMKSKLAQLRKQLEVSSQHSEDTMREIERDNTSIENATVLVKADEEVANKKAAIAALLKTECEADLAVAIPILEDAIAALNTLKPTDITLVKAMKNPPDTVKLVMAAICVMLEVPPDRIIDSVTGKKTTDYWGPSKRVLSDMNFLQILKDYDKDNISPCVMQIIQKTYMTDSSFQPRIVAKASSAAEGLCKWVRAMVSYDKVAKVVAPKKEKLAIAKNECDLAESYLEEKRKALAELNDKMTVLKNTLQIALSKKEQLEFEVTSCNNKLKKAEDLISSLINEKDRWLETANDLQKRLVNISGDMILISGIITYLGSFNCHQREIIVNKWHQIIKQRKLHCSVNCDIIDILRLELNASSWIVSGLSNDSYSLQNAAIVDNSLLRTFLFKDPNKIGSRWIKNMEANFKELKIIRINDNSYIEIIRRSMEIGNAVIIESTDLETLNCLSPIICQPIYSDFEKLYIDFGDTTIIFNKNFRLYIICISHEPENIIMDVYSKITIIDFSVTDEAVKLELSNILISRERPNFSDKFKDLELQSINNKKIIKEEEGKILHVLSTSKGNIIEDEQTINVLVTSKDLCQKKVEFEKEFKYQKIAMNSFCEKYEQFFIFTSNLFTNLNLLSKLKYAYRFSLFWFISLYKTSIETSNVSSNIEKRLFYLKQSVLKNIYASICRCLFEEDKIVYSFLTSIKIQLYAEKIKIDEVDCFMKTNFEFHLSAETKNPVSSWLLEKSWQQICFVSQNFNIFQQLINSFKNDSTAWKLYYESNNHQELPSPWSNLSTFHQLIIIRILCPHKMIASIRKFINETVGYIPDLNLQRNVAKSYIESNCLTPIMFFLPSYSSTMSAVSNHAKIIGSSSQIIHLFMGQEETENKANLLIEDARVKGNWIFIHNCHLSSRTWLLKLDDICEKFDTADTNLEFRLWLSNFADSNKIPANILQNSIKIACDVPKDIKSHLLKFFSSKNNALDNLNLCELSADKYKIFSKLLYGLCLHHAIISERKKFGYRSWNVSYDFAESNLHASVKFLTHLIKRDIEFPFKMLDYFVGTIIYGGQILDTFDEQILNISRHYFCLEINYPYSCTKSKKFYDIPEISDHKKFAKFINENSENYPEDSPSQIFGLDVVGEKIRCNLKLNNFLDRFFQIETCMKYQEQELKSKESFVKCILKTIELKLPNSFDEQFVSNKYPFNYLEPLNNLLQNETKRYNEILNMIYDTLKQFNNFYDGKMIENIKLEELEKQLYYNKVPLTWKMGPLSYTERSLSAFLNELCERINFIKIWICSGHPKHFVLRALTYPSALFNAIKLKIARNQAIAINEVFFDYIVVHDSEECLNDNDIFLNEFYLSGAVWNKECRMLCEGNNKIIFYKMPPICLHINVDKIHYDTLGHFYNCPLYISSVGRNKNISIVNQLLNYICTVNLASKNDSVNWIMNGTALYCDTE